MVMNITILISLQVPDNYRAIDDFPKKHVTKRREYALYKCHHVAVITVTLVIPIVMGTSTSEKTYRGVYSLQEAVSR